MLSDSFVLRKACSEDVSVTFKWYTDRQIREYSGDPGLNSFEQHKKWFDNAIQSMNCLYLIGLFENQPIGSIRFDLKDSKAKISYLVDPAFQGRGFGKKIIQMGLQELNKVVKDRVSTVYGMVMPVNAASLAIFRKLGFREHNQNTMIEFEIDNV